jgi:predicted nucleic acid-binding protein
MNKLSVYLDTTIPSYLFDEREELKALIQITQQWWAQERQRFELYISEETLTELNKGNYPNKTAVLGSVAETLILPAHPRIAEIVTAYVDNYLMPREVKADAIHLAYASLYQLDFLLTWNYNHLANANKRRHIQVINSRLGLSIPDIVTPLQLFKEKI